MPASVSTAVAPLRLELPERVYLEQVAQQGFNEPGATALVCTLVPGVAWAERERALAEVQTEGMAFLVWDALAGVADVLVSMWEDNGPSLDPWGRPQLTSEPGGDGLLVSVPMDER